MKVKPFTLPLVAGAILVCGSSRPAAILYGRVLEAIKDSPEWSVNRSMVPAKGYDYIYSTDAIPLDIARSCRETMVIADESAEGKTHSQECLSNSDWQSLRDVERQLLAMHKAGLWALPDEVRQRMQAREDMRKAVDAELL